VHRDKLEAMELMARFAERTGLVGERPQRRHLWTDAHAVCNFLALGEHALALALIDRVGRSEHPKWICALDEAARATGDDRLARCARELAASVDDPLAGYVTCLQLGLEKAAAGHRAQIDPHALATADPLRLGGLLYDASRVDRELRDALLAAARVGLDHYAAQPDLRLAAEHRLAFRELALAIGLAAAQVGANMRTTIEAFWRDPDHRRSRTYCEHEDINDVMLAAVLVQQLPRTAGDRIAIRPLPAAVQRRSHR
jgi:hypothetical protein